MQFEGGFVENLSWKSRFRVLSKADYVRQAPILTSDFFFFGNRAAGRWLNLRESERISLHP
jgi:hypothetical protein